MSPYCKGFEIFAKAVADLWDPFLSAWQRWFADHVTGDAATPCRVCAVTDDVIRVKCNSVAINGAEPRRDESSSQTLLPIAPLLPAPRFDAPRHHHRAVIGGIASCAVAAFALYARLTSIERWVAFAVGAMLAVVFLDILPHALSEGVAPASLMAWVLGGVLFLLFLENS